MYVYESKKSAKKGWVRIGGKRVYGDAVVKEFEDVHCRFRPGEL